MPLVVSTRPKMVASSRTSLVLLSRFPVFFKPPIKVLVVYSKPCREDDTTEQQEQRKT